MVNNLFTSICCVFVASVFIVFPSENDKIRTQMEVTYGSKLPGTLKSSNRRKEWWFISRLTTGKAPKHKVLWEERNKCCFSRLCCLNNAANDFNRFLPVLKRLLKWSKGRSLNQKLMFLFHCFIAGVSDIQREDRVCRPRRSHRTHFLSVSLSSQLWLWRLSQHLPESCAHRWSAEIQLMCTYLIKSKYAQLHRWGNTNIDGYKTSQNRSIEKIQINIIKYRWSEQRCQFYSNLLDI